MTPDDPRITLAAELLPIMNGVPTSDLACQMSDWTVVNPHKEVGQGDRTRPGPRSPRQAGNAVTIGPRDPDDGATPRGGALAIPTTYRGCRFRSRTEARWAVLFDELGIRWQYEPQGYVIGGRPYLPDFLLECGTWVEVKGSEDQLDHQLMRSAALELPSMPAAAERGPKLLVLGGTALQYIDMPGDYGWLGLDLDGRDGELIFGYYGFGRFWRHRRPWLLEERTGDGPWLRPRFFEWEYGCIEAYNAANGARFEHGESGAA